MPEIDQKFLKNKRLIRIRLKKEALDSIWTQCTRKVNASMRMNRTTCIYTVPEQIFGNYVYNVSDGVKHIRKKLEQTPNISFEFKNPNTFIIEI